MSNTTGKGQWVETFVEYKEGTFTKAVEKISGEKKMSSGPAVGLN